MNNRIFEIIRNNLVLKRTTVEVVPQDEPVFILRARDRGALATIRVNQARHSPTSEAWKIHQKVIEDFTKFREENPKLVGEPEECY